MGSDDVSGQLVLGRPPRSGCTAHARYRGSGRRSGVHGRCRGTQSTTVCPRSWWAARLLVIAGNRRPATRVLVSNFVAERARGRPAVRPPDSRRALQQLCELHPAQLRSGRSPRMPSQLPESGLPVADAVSGVRRRGEPEPRGAVEIEERTDVGPAGLEGMAASGSVALP